MSVLENFYIMFKSDISEVKKGIEEVKKLLDQQQKATEDLDEKTKKVGNSFLELAKAAGKFLGLGYAAHTVLRHMNEASDYAVQLGDASRALNVNASELDAWGNAVKNTGGTAEGFQHSLRALADHFGTTSQVALRTLPQLADTFHRLSNFRALQYGKILGLDESTILLLQSGRREVETMIQRQRELGVVSQQDIEISQKYRQANNDLDTAFRSLDTTLGRTVIPILTKFYNFLVPIIEYVKRHKDLVIGAFIGIGAAAVIMLAPFIAANLPIIAATAAITALIAAVAIAYEDIKAYFEGHESLTGDLIKRWSHAKNVVTDAIRAMGFIFFDAFLKPIELALKAVEKLFHYFGGDKKLTADIEGAKYLLDSASSSPIASQTSNSIFNSQASSKNNSVVTGPITVNTQATSPVGIGTALGKGIQEHLWQANNQFGDGVAY